MAIYSPIFAAGIAYQSDVDVMAAGAKTALPLSSAGLAVGMHLFCAAKNGTRAAYLGKVTAWSGSFIDFERAAPFAATNDHTFFAAESVWQASDVPGTGATVTSYESGIETLDTTGRDLLHTRVRDEREYVEFSLRDIMATEWQAYRAWVRSALDGGLKNFVCAYVDHDAGAERVDVVKFRQPGNSLRATESAKVLRAWTVELQIVKRNAYE